jgi:hypothetical protein
MKRTVCAIAVFALVFGGGAALAQDTRTHSESISKSDGTKVKSESVTGVVKEFEAGKSIKVLGPKNKSYKFDLDENARVEGTIVVGQKAKVTYTKVNGKERVDVVSAASTEAAEMAAAPKSHTESTMKSTSSEGTTKVKTETVVGTVKEFEAGKKIVVTGPKSKKYTFDLDDDVQTTGTVAVGDRVKVTYKKVSGHNKVSVVAAYTGKA